VDEFLCITVLSQPGEKQADFSGRLSRFWTQMLRSRPDDFEKVYAESTAFEPHGDRLGRSYLVAEDVIALLETDLARAGIDFEPVDRDETYTKYEAVPPEWMQIEH
jgi:hypothetical protein